MLLCELGVCILWVGGCVSGFFVCLLREGETCCFVLSACKMSGNKEAPRILLCGDVNGHLHALYKRVLAV